MIAFVSASAEDTSGLQEACDVSYVRLDRLKGKPAPETVGLFQDRQVSGQFSLQGNPMITMVGKGTLGEELLEPELMVPEC